MYNQLAWNCGYPQEIITVLFLSDTGIVVSHNVSIICMVSQPT